MKAWIVWNPKHSEGVVFTHKGDAYMTAREDLRKLLNDGCAVPALGEEFQELWEEDMPLDIQEIELP